MAKSKKTNGGRRPRWNSDAGTKELQRIARNYNAKINRLRRQHKDSGSNYLLSLLPEKSEFSKSKNVATSRKEYYDEIKRMENFIKTGRSFEVHHKTEEALDRTVKSFNAKITKLTKKAIEDEYRDKIKQVQDMNNVSDERKALRTAALTLERDQKLKEAEKNRRLAGLPEKLDKNTILQNAVSQDELRRDIQTYRDFLKDGAEEIITLDTKNNTKTTKWQKEATEAALTEANAAREQEKEEWRKTKAKYGGKEQDYTNEELRMGRETSEFDPLSYYNDMTRESDLNRTLKQAMRERKAGYWDRRTKIAKDNYTDIVKRYIGQTDAGKMILEELDSMDLSEFKRMLTAEADLFTDVYTAHKANPEGYNTAVARVWGDWHPDEDMDEAIAAWMAKK